MTHTASAQGVPAPIAHLIKTQLAPQVLDIDRKGRYPRSFMHALGALGGFAAYHNLAAQIAITAAVGEECGGTAFLVWCQSSCALYLRESGNQAVRDRYLADVSQGRLLAGTGMSNAVKHLAGIEQIHLRARRQGNNGYIVNGALPWVSNVGPDHLVIVAARLEDEGYIMFAVPGGAQGYEQHACLEFSGLEGTQTLNLRFREVHVPHEDVLAHPEQFKDYLQRIKPAFVLGQTGMGLGITRACLKIMQDSNSSKAHVNCFLDDQHEDLAPLLDDLQTQIDTLSSAVDHGSARLLPILKARAASSELTLRAANAAILHAGAKGYLMIHPAQRHLREAVFVAIVTPALKHLRKEIHYLESLSDDPALATQAAAHA